VEQEPQTALERAILLLRASLVPGWHPTAGQGLVWAIRCALVLGVLVLIAFAVDRTLWDWLDLLIVPVVLAVGAYLFTRAENRRTQRIATQRAQDEALQAYLDYLSERILKEDLRSAKEGTGLRRLTRARTLTVLETLGPKSKGRVMQFLAEMGLIQKRKPAREKLRSYKVFKIEAVISLRGADLSDAYLRRANLYAVGLLDVDLSNANLSSANLIAAKLRKADLSRANLSGADLRGADLSYAILVGANLREANLREANLRGAFGWREEQLTAAEFLESATMPNGQKYEAWLKGKEDREERGKDSAP
jgi:hypothetical protein